MAKHSEHVPESDIEDMKRLKSEEGWTMRKISKRYSLKLSHVRSILKGVSSIYEDERNYLSVDLEGEMQKLPRNEGASRKLKNES